jgi:uncharacterized membrane protein
MSAIGIVHLSAAVAALVFGAAVLLSTKGTRRHRQLGWTYVASMLGLNLTALMIYRLFGRFGPFHVFALISLVSVSAGTLAAVRARRARVARDLKRRSQLVEQHYQFMTWSYLGLCAAAVSEIATRIPAFHPGPGAGLVFGIAVAVSTILVMVVGGRLIVARRTRVLQPFTR